MSEGEQRIKSGGLQGLERAARQAAGRRGALSDELGGSAAGRGGALPDELGGSAAGRGGALPDELGGSAAGRGPPPVHLWNPPDCGDIDMRIAADGTWFYMGTPIGRPAMVRLFSTILRRDGERYVLVTPVEKVGIKVDDAPFLAVYVEITGEAAGQVLNFRTNVEDWTEAGPEHPLRVEIDPVTGAPRPYIHVRGGLEALIARSVFYELVGLADASGATLGIWSNGTRFPLGPKPDGWS
jgi:hypothetical protein